MLDPIQILDGFFHLVFKDEKVEEFAKRRAEVCNTCDKISKDYVPTCTVCGCTIGAKTRAKKSECPLKKWPV